MSQSRFTLVGGLVCDGSRKPMRRANVVVQGDRVVEIAEGIVEGREIDVAGLVVAPGFVDVHSHADWVAPLPEAMNLLAPLVQQGITTTVGGNCGSSPAPILHHPDGGAMERVLCGFAGWKMDWNWRSLSDFGGYVESHGLPLNLATFVGHSSLRAQVMGEAERPATPSEIARMSYLAATAVDDGAVGLSFGFEYFPGRSAGTDEAVAVASAIPGGVVAMHTRGLSSLYSKGMNEALEIGARSRRPIQVSHVNPHGRAFQSVIDEWPDLLTRARTDRVEVNLDAVVYTVWKLDGFFLLFPSSVVERFGRDGVRVLASSSDGRARLRAMVEECVPRWPSWAPGEHTRNAIVDIGWNDLVLCETAAQDYAGDIGQSIAEVARVRNSDPFELLCQLITADPESTRILNASTSGDMVDDKPMQRLFRLERMMPATDATPTRGRDGAVMLDMPHSYGTMPRFLGRFCRDLELFPLEEAIWRMTALPAEWLHLEGRGRLQAGSYADIVAFDPATVSDRGSLLRPETPAGIGWVFVNGTAVVREGALDLSAVGRFVRA